MGKVRCIIENECSVVNPAQFFLVIPELRRSCASTVIYSGLTENGFAFEGVDKARTVLESDIRLFGQPERSLKRHMGVAVCNAETPSRHASRQAGCIAGEADGGLNETLPGSDT